MHHPRINSPRIETRFASLVTATSAAALVAASAGFGAFYAWTTGSHHGPFVGALSVLMSLGLEGAKPFAIEGVFAALRSWSPIRAAALALLGSVAIAYSFTAELSLMAATRADASAGRSHAADTAAAAKARYVAAQRELEALPVTRPVAAVNAEIARLKTTPRLAPCDDTTAPGYGATTRRVCAQIAALSAEAATSARRDELRTTLRSAERGLETAPLATDADPAASALVMFLAAASVPTDAKTVSEWLALVPVLALEVGSALAVVLISGTAARRIPYLDGSITVPTSAQDVAADYAKNRNAAPTGLKAALMEHVRERGGSVRSGQRGLAKALGTSTTELHRAIHALAAGGLVALRTTRSGTVIRLL